MKINRSERKRVSIVFSIFMIWIIAIVFMLIKIQVLGFNKYLGKIRSQSNRTLTLHPKRGTIFDYNNEVLAISIQSKSLFISNRSRKSSLSLFKKIRRVIRISSSSAKKILMRIKKGKNFIWIKRKLSEKEYNAVKSLNQSGYTSKYSFVDEYKRIYPNSQLAGHILGGVGVDEQGLAGIEYSMESVIRGKGGKISASIDARSKIFKFENISERVTGKDLKLTIDSAVQFFVQSELKKTVKKYNAVSGSVIVMNSSTGSIIAMASYPFYNPGRIRYTSPKIVKNNSLSFLYYPGSTFKIILASSALLHNVCNFSETINCYNGVYSINNLKITDEHPFEQLSFRDVIVLSSNIGAARVGMRIGDNRFYNDLKKFGIGSAPNIRLPAVEKGILNPLERWNRYSSAYLSHGYEVYVTPIQMTRAFNVIASGGFLVEPVILKSVKGYLFKKLTRKRIISREIAAKLRDVMVDVVKRGTGKKAFLSTVEIAGKTGTAKKFRGNRFINKYVSSFGGFFPAGNPVITMFIVINEPKGSFYGGDVAAPLFKSIAKRIIILKNIDVKLDSGTGMRI